MKKHFLRVPFIFILLLGGFLAKSQDNSLTQEEIKYLKEKDVITIANEMDWPPFDYVEDNIPTGYSIELIELVAEQTGFEVEFINQLTWVEILEEFKKGKIDVLPAVYEDEERKEWMLFSKPYFTQPTIIAHHSSIIVNELQDLIGKRVAVIKGFSITTELKENYPEIIYIEVDNALEGLKKVSVGEADAMLESIGAVSYLLNDTYLPNISINADVELPNMDAPSLHMGVLKSNPILLSIIQKGLDGLDKEVVNQLKKKWFPLMVVSHDQNTAASVEEGLFSWWYVLYSAILLIIVVFLTRYLLNKYVTEKVALEFGSTRFRVKTYVFLSIVSVLIIIMGFLSIGYIKQDILKQVEISLENDLENSNKRLEFWLKQKTKQLNAFGKDALLVELTTKLLNASSINDSVQFKEIESKINRYINFAGSTGYYLVDTNSIITTSSIAKHQKQANHILKKHPDYISNALKGESVFIPPLSKELKASFPPKLRGITLMYITSPIVRSDGEVIAVLVHQINPIGEISEVLKLSQVGTTGESYLFDNDAEIITKSRFQKDLEELAYFDKNPLGQLIIELRNPGVDITKGSVSINKSKVLPYTYMAEQALKGENGVDIKGYSDYRGVEVFGAWRWIDALDMGLASEIDSDEALQTFYFIRSVAIIVLAVTIILLAVIVLFTVVLGEKANKALLKAKDNLELQVEERTKELYLRSTALDSAANGIAITDVNGIFLWVNRAFSELTGYHWRDVEGKRTDILKSGKHNNAFYKDLWETISRGDVWNGEIINKKKNGDFYHEEMTITPVKNEDNEVINFVAIKQDISDRKEAELEIQKQKTLLENTIESLPHPFYVVNTKDYSLSLANQAAKSLSSSGHLTTCFALTHKVDSPCDSEYDPCPLKIIKETKEPVVLEHTHFDKDGGKIFAEVHGYPIFDEKGEVVQMIEYSLDITERKNAEEVIQASNQRFQAIVDNIADALIIIDGKGSIQFFSPSAQKLFQHVPEEIKGKNVNLLMNSPHKENHDQYLSNYLESGEAKIIGQEREVEAVRKDGTLFPARLMISEVRTANNRFFVGLISDQTERKKYEAAIEESNKRMSTELNVAKDIQMSMLPLTFPAFPKRKDLDVYAELLPAREVGGDFYDFFFIDKDHFCFVVGDVSGKGVPAALMMAVCKTLIKSNSRNVHSTAKIMTWVNNEMAKENDNAMFVTVFIGILNMKTGELTYTNAGHNPSFIKHNDNSVSKLTELHGVVIAAMEGIKYKESKIKLNKNDTVFAYTDGIPEAHNNNGVMYGDDQLYDLLNKGKFASPQEMIVKVVKSVRDFEDGFESFDDITALSIIYKNPDQHE